MLHGMYAANDFCDMTAKHRRAAFGGTKGRPSPISSF